jgi:hypothetical protein
VHVTRRLFWPLLASVVAAIVTGSVAVGNNGERNERTFKYTNGPWGDLPWSDLQATFGVPNLIAHMNDSDSR